MVNTSIILLCRHGGKVIREKRDRRNVGYVGGTCVLTKAPSRHVSISELKKIVCKAFEWNDYDEGDIELSWRMTIPKEFNRYELVNLNTPISLATSLEYFDNNKMSKFFEIIVMKRRVSNEVDGAHAQNPIFVTEEDQEENGHATQIKRMLDHVLRGGQVAAEAMKNPMADKNTVLKEVMKICRSVFDEAGEAQRFDESVGAVTTLDQGGSGGGGGWHPFTENPWRPVPTQFEAGVGPKRARSDGPAPYPNGPYPNVPYPNWGHYERVCGPGLPKNPTQERTEKSGQSSRPSLFGGKSHK